MLTLALSDSIWLFLTLLGSLWLPWAHNVLARLTTPWPRGHILFRPGTASSFHFLIFCGFYLAISNSQPQETALIARHALSIRLIIQLVLWDTSLARTTSMILIVFEDKIRLARHLLDTRSLVTRLWDRRTCWTRSQQNITRLMSQHNLRTNNWLQPGKHLLGEITRKNISPAGFLPFFREKKCCTSATAVKMYHHYSYSEKLKLLTIL